MPVQVDTHFTSNTVAWPGDYELTFLEDYSETVNSITGITHPVKINFTAKNITSGANVVVRIFDVDNDSILSLYDQILLSDSYGGASKITYLIGYYPPVNSPFTLFPHAGDIYRVSTSKPFAENDYFSFNTSSARIDKGEAKSDLDKILVVPNPYVATAEWERKTLSVNGRGERRIDFINLPSICTVRIYTIAGALVKTLNKDSEPINGSLSWNLVSDDGMDVAYGLYIYHVEAPGVGEKIGKFALIK